MTLGLTLYCKRCGLRIIGMEPKSRHRAFITTHCHHDWHLWKPACSYGIEDIVPDETSSKAGHAALPRSRIVRQDFDLGRC